MTIRFAPGRDPRKVPQFTLWTMRKNERVREARTRLLPIGEGLLELGIYELRTDGSLDLLWSQTLGAGDVRELARRAQRQYEVEGWSTACAKCHGAGWVCEAHPESPMEHQLAESSGHCDGAGMPCSCELGQQLAATLDETYRRDQ